MDELIISPQMVTLGDCDFPFIEGDVDGYKTLRLPHRIRRHFEEGAHVVRINSIELADAIPDFEGRTSGKHSLLPHRDHFGNTKDRRRYLMLSKATHGARGATTLVMLPNVAPEMLRIEEAFFTTDYRDAAGAERSYDERFSISKRQYDQCFDEERGYEEVVAQMLRPGASMEERISLRLNILDYLIRGPLADMVLREMRKQLTHFFLEEHWERGGVLIIDNACTFHARAGGNDPPLQRNFCE